MSEQDQDVDPLLKEQKEIEEIASVDLDEFRVKHGVITKMHYRDDMPDDVIENGNECTDSER